MTTILSRNTRKEHTKNISRHYNTNYTVDHVVHIKLMRLWKFLLRKKKRLLCWRENI